MGSISMCHREWYGFHAVYSRIGYRNQRIGSRVGYLFPDPTCYTSQNSYRAAVFGKRNSLLSTKDGSYVQYQRWWQHAIHTQLLLAGKKYALAPHAEVLCQDHSHETSSKFLGVPSPFQAFRSWDGAERCEQEKQRGMDALRSLNAWNRLAMMLQTGAITKWS